jgi:hypothetical protein
MISGIQNRECHQAFFAAALVTLHKLDREIAALPENEAVVALQKLGKEITEICTARSETLKARN